MHFMVIEEKKGIRKRKQFSGLTTHAQGDLCTIEGSRIDFFNTYKHFISTTDGPFKRNALVSAHSEKDMEVKKLG